MIRGIPEDREAEQFINHKGYYSLNAMITGYNIFLIGLYNQQFEIGGIDRKIYDIVLSAPGSYHDAAVYAMSRGKAWFETQNRVRYFNF